MRRSTLHVALPALLTGAALTACQFLGMPLSEEPGGCSPQLPAGYRIQATVPVGVLEVTVTDEQGLPQAGASVTASWEGVSNVYPKPSCPGMVRGETDANGLLRLERMKTGPYRVYVYGDGKVASASAEVEAHAVTRVALPRP